MILDVLFPARPLPRLRASVTMAARNEERLLPAALAALQKQTDLRGQPLAAGSFEVLLLVNNSDDRTGAIAKRFQTEHPAFQLRVAIRRFPADRAYVGHMRKLLMDEASERLQMPGHSESLILTTDADTRVAPDWIAANGAEAARGAEAIGGRILIDADERAGLPEQVCSIQRLDDCYRRLVSWLESLLDPWPGDPWPRHHQHFCGSFAVRPSAYRKVGGIPDVPQLEDAAFYARLMQYDVRVRHSCAARVYTSARLEGRTTAGLATQLAEWNGRNGEQVLVESAAYWRDYFLTRRMLRVAWQRASTHGTPCRGATTVLGERLDVAPERLADALGSGRHFGSVLEQLAFDRQMLCAWPEPARLRPLASVTTTLMRQFVQTRRRQSYASRARRCDSALLAS